MKLRCFPPQANSPARLGKIVRQPQPARPPISPTNPVLPRIALGLALLFLAPGCVTYSKDKAIERMSEQEKSALAQLSKITKQTTKAEVREMLGPPKRSESWDSWEYYINPGIKTTTTTFITQTSVGTMATPTQMSSSTSDSSVRIFFKNDRVTQINFTHPGLADGWFFYVLK